MPRNDSIIISIVDMDNIIALLANQQIKSGVIKIIDGGDVITVRDVNDFLIGHFAKTN
jgi:hypothetical protein